MPKQTHISSTVESDNKAADKHERQELTVEQKELRDMIIKRATYARDQREQSLHEFNGMTYMQDYVSNLDAINSYLQPKKNRNDVRVNTATIQKKHDVFVNELLALNIKAEILAFDSNDTEMVHLGKDMEHIVERTNQLEEEEDMLVDMYRELVGQRAVFVEESVVTRKTNGRTIKRAEKRLVPGRRVYLGDINIPAHKFNSQPFYVKYTALNYDTAQMFFGHLDAFKNVKKGGGETSSLANLKEEGHQKWRMHSLQNNEVEIVEYYSAPHNEYNMIINGVLMYPDGKKLPWKHEGYNMTMTVVKGIRPDFAYGMPPIATAKTLHALENEVIVNLVRKFRQAISPPLGTTSKKIFSADIFEPSAITQGVNKNTFEKLVDHTGITNSEYAFYNLITQKVEESIGVTNLQQGLSPQGEQTATQTLKQLQQAVKMLGMVILAAMRLRKHMTRLRINTILNDFTSPKGLTSSGGKLIKEFERFTVKDVDVGGGVRGKKVIQFTDEEITEEDKKALFEVEERMERLGKPVRFSFVNVKRLKDFPIFWYIVANQEERAGSALNKVLNRERTAGAVELMEASGGEVKVNFRKAAKDYEAGWGVRDLFETAPQQRPEQAEQNPQVAGKARQVLNQLSSLQGASRANGAAGGQLLEVANRQTRQPSINTLERE